MKLDVRQRGDVEIDEYHELRCAVYAVDYRDLPMPTRQATAAQLAVPPALADVTTYTGADNVPMMDVNHRLGYETVRHANAVGRALAL